MEQRNEEVGAEVTRQICTVTLSQEEFDAVLADKNTEIGALRKIVQEQARMFADQQRATPFEDAVRSMLKHEFNNMTLDLLKKLRAEGFFKE